MSASAALAAEILAVLRSALVIGVYDGKAVQAALPHAIVEVGPESDWGHKSGAGRELRMAVTIHDGGERPDRVRALMASADQALAGIAGPIGGWQLVSLVFMRSRLLRTGPVATAGWSGVSEFRARLLAAG